MTTTANTTLRTFLRGETATFTIHFYADAAGTVPLVPLDVALYPAYSIYDINNQVIQSGVGQPEITPGRYKTNFLVSKTVPLSNDTARWRIEWTMVSVDDRQVDFVEEFDVRDETITAAETREISFVTLAGNTYRAVLRLPDVANEVFLDVYVADQFNTPIVSNASEGIGGILRVADGDSIVYYFDILGSKLGGNCTFNLIWKIRNTPIEPFQFVYQVLSSVSPSVLGSITSLRHILDKLLKRRGIAQAYEDSHLLEYLQKGHQLVNSTYPTTYYGFGGLPGVFDVFHILYSAWYGLQAQQILEVELGFNFSGQTVTLDYDHQGALADIGGRWTDFIEKNLGPAKMSVVRRTQASGAVGGRSYRLLEPTFTYRVASYRGIGAGNLVGTLNHLGLLF